MSMDIFLLFPTYRLLLKYVYLYRGNKELINISLLMGDVLSVHISLCFGAYVEFAILQNVFNHVLR